MVHHNPLSLSGLVKCDGNKDFQVYTADLGGALLEEAVIPAWTRIAEVLALV
jgi:hypothetical protein